MFRSIVFMFSGQGSQYYQMGRELFTHHPGFRKWMVRLDDAAHEIIGEHVLDHLYHEERRKDERFDRTLYSHPAIFMVEYSLAQVFQESGIYPDYVLGTSLGEFASATCAGVMGVEGALAAVLKQAEVFETYCQKSGMLAVLSAPPLYQETPLFYENSELAAVNCHEHFVVSGKNEALKDIEEFLKRNGVLYQTLPVSYGFHSSLVDPAADAYRSFLTSRTFQSPRVPLVSCLLGTTLARVPRDYFWDVVRNPVEFRKTIQAFENDQDHLYLDLGPSGTLANFVKRNLDNGSPSESHAVITPFNQELKNLEKIKTAIYENRSSQSGERVRIC